MPETIIESHYDDRKVSMSSHGVLAILDKTRHVQVSAFPSPLGARQLIDALEPFAAPRPAPVLPPIDVVAVLDAALLPQPGQMYEVVYSYRGKPAEKTDFTHAAGQYPLHKAQELAASLQHTMGAIFLYTVRPVAS